MTDPRFPQRKSPRLQGYDYAQNGAYFVTICSHQRAHYFGQVKNATMQLTPIGEIAQSRWDDLPNHFDHVELDAFVVMPNHVHGVILLNATVTDATGGVPTVRKPAPLGVVIQSYKAAVTRHMRQTISNPPEELWQSRYYDHIIRNQAEYDVICVYVLENPARWQADTFYAV